MINKIINKYKKYDLYYDAYYKILFTYKPMLVKDFVNIKNIIRDYNLDVKEIRIVERKI